MGRRVARLVHIVVSCIDFRFLRLSVILQVMNRIIIFLLLWPGMAFGNWVGKLDLSSSGQAIILREGHDGQWLAGLSHPNLWHLDHNGNPLLHLGLFQAWNADNGNASFGPLAGLDLLGASKEVGVDVPGALGSLGEYLGLPSVFKPAVLFSQMLSIDAFVGYRPFHTPDVSGRLVYGGAATLKVPFGVKELQAGL